ncbi:MAG: hypothetical protein JNM02_01680 [Anaerolineales bacterium]|nr:hypothetical protein [Anaerolineales bacterium]
MSKPENPKQRIFIIASTILGCLLIFFFGLRAFHAFMKFKGHRPPQPAPGQIETDVELIREWMTIPFIARMYYVPEKVLYDALDIPPRENRDKSLEEINKEYFPETNGLAMQLVKAAILAHQPPPTAVLPLTPIPPLTPLPPLTPVPPVTP